MVNYEEKRRDKFLAAATMSLTGVLLDPPDSTRADFMAGHRALVQCRCHEDPCACDGPIVWVKRASVEVEMLTARRNRAGEVLTELRVDPDAPVLVELVVRTRARVLGNGEARAASDWPLRVIWNVSCTEICHRTGPFGLFTSCVTICPDPDAGVTSDV
jgi:hypothetical protein